MILKGNQRSGGQQLATHLLNALDNEEVQVAEIRGSIAQDLHGAFKEWQAIARGTRCKKYLYSLSVNPDHRQASFSKDDYTAFITRTEEKLGLSGQPRAVVFHTKNDRHHCHVIWSRIHPEDLKAVQIAHDRLKLKSLSQEFAKQYGFELPAGLQPYQKRVPFNENARPVNLAEKQQEERTGFSKKQRQMEIGNAWQATNTADGLIQALKEKGYQLAQGSKRAYVLVDRFGEIHSLSRQLKAEIPSLKTRDIKDRLHTNFPPENLLSPDTIRKELKENAAPAPLKFTFHYFADHRRFQLIQSQKNRRASFEQTRRLFAEQRKKEKQDLLGRHQLEKEAILLKRAQTKPSGLANFLGLITGVNRIIEVRHKKQDFERLRKFRQEWGAYIQRQSLLSQDLERHHRSLLSIDKREKQSLETMLRSLRLQTLGKNKTEISLPAYQKKILEDWKTAVRPAPTLPDEPLSKNFNRHANPGKRPLTRGQKEKIALFKANARKLTEQVKRIENKKADSLSQKFSQAQDPLKDPKISNPQKQKSPAKTPKLSSTHSPS